MKRCVVTGATGLVGSHLVEQLSKSGWEVWGLIHSQSPRLTNSEQIHWVSADLAEALPVQQLPEKLDAVFHMAQSEKFRDFPGSANEVFRVNTLSTVNLLDYALKSGANHLIYASTGGIYGTSDEPFTESSQPRMAGNLGFYATSKFCSELVLQNYTSLLNVVTIRFFFVYGPRQKSSMLVPRLIDSVDSGKPIQLQGETGIRINPIFVDDAVNALIRTTALATSEVINIGGSENLTLRQIGEAIGACLGKAPQFEVNTQAQPGHVMGDITTMKTLLGDPQVSFKEGVGRVIASRQSELAPI